MARTDLDFAAYKALVSNASDPERMAALRGLVRVAREHLEGGDCPDCGNAGPHEDNGEMGVHRAFCCTACGAQWEAQS